MNAITHTNRHARAVLSTLAAAGLLCAARARANDYAALHTLGAAEGAEYIAQRDGLLRSHPEPWDVEQASGHSWQAGLAAYILNARLREPEAFAAWATGVEEWTRRGHIQSISLGFNHAHPNVEFRLEFAWKPPDWVAEIEHCEKLSLEHYGRARSAALLAFRGFSARWEGSPYPLWLAIWQHCDIPEFRLLAIDRLAGSDRPEHQQIGLDVLLGAEYSTELRLRAMWGYSSRKPPELTDTVLRLINAPDTPEELGVSAIVSLGTTSRRKQNDPRAHAALRDVAQNARKPEALRCAAIEACGRDPRPEDDAILSAALRQTDLARLQRTAASQAAGRESLRPVLREVMYNHANLTVVSAALAGLLRGGEADIEFVRAYANDASVSEDARKMAAGKLYRFEERQRQDAESERQRLERLRKGQSREEWMKEQNDERMRKWIQAQREEIRGRADPETGELSPEDRARLEAIDAEERKMEQPTTGTPQTPTTQAAP